MRNAIGKLDKDAGTVSKLRSPHIVAVNANGQVSELGRAELFVELGLFPDSIEAVKAPSDAADRSKELLVGLEQYSVDRGSASNWDSWDSWDSWDNWNNWDNWTNY